MWMVCTKERVRIDADPELDPITPLPPEKQPIDFQPAPSKIIREAGPGGRGEAVFSGAQAKPEGPTRARAHLAAEPESPS